MAERIIVKIGSRLLTENSGRLSVPKLESYVDSLSGLHNAGYEVVVVSSGSIAAGFEKLGYPSRPVRTRDRQASAAVGQGLLIEAYARAFSKQKVTVAQILLTRKDFTCRDAYNNALGTLELLLEKRAVPVINENDTVAVEEINYGDNDVLAALLSGLLRADRLLLLTDTPGLFTADPTIDKTAKHIPTVERITPEIEALGGESSSGVGSGGMRSKLRAARRALSLGVPVYIGTVQTQPDIDAQENSFRRILNGQGQGTYFGSPDISGFNRKRQWLAFHSVPSGTLVIDDGAVSALVESGKSLLPVGISLCDGNFLSGDVVEVVDSMGKILGKGISRYSAAQVAASCGKSTAEIQNLLGEQYSVVLHRDDWVCLVGLLNPGGNDG